jgi:hypothetical protein
MEKTLTQLQPIPVEFVVGHAQTKNTDGQRKPYIELIRQWAEHEGMEDEGLVAVRRLMNSTQIDPEHMPREFYQQYRNGDKATQLIRIINDINNVILSGEEMWTWAHVMRVMIDENILMANVSVNRFDALICSMIPGKGRDTVRKHGDYVFLLNQKDPWALWPSQAYLNPSLAAERSICNQIALQFAPVLQRKIVVEM